MTRKKCGSIMIFPSFSYWYHSAYILTALTSAGESDLISCRALLIPEEVPNYNRACAGKKSARQ